MGRRLLIEADGGSRGNPGPAGYGAVVRDALTGDVLAERAAAIGVATNNVAEYGGLIAGLRAALELDPSEVEVRMDSKLVVEQMSGRWQVKHPSMKPLAREAAGLIAQLPSVRFAWVPREKNKHADRLANEAMDAAATGGSWAPDSAQAFLETAAVQQSAPPNRLSGWQDPPSPPTTTLLLRHGQTALSIERRFSGVGDQPLTDLGRAQAAAAAVRLAATDAVAVISSPLRRARETALLVGEATGLEVAIDDGFRETDFGDWEGHTFREVREKWPRELDEWLASSAVAPPFGESVDETTARVRQARDRMLSSYGGENVVVVAPRAPLKGPLRGAPATAPGAPFPGPPPPPRPHQ